VVTKLATVALVVFLAALFTVLGDPRPAHAVTFGQGLKLAGGTRVAAPLRLLGAVSPYGWAFTAAVTAYNTSDLWLPVVKGALGKLSQIGDSQPQPANTAGCKFSRNFTDNSPKNDTDAAANGYTVVAQGQCGSFYGTGNLSFTNSPYTLVCKATASGGISSFTGTAQAYFIRSDQTGTATFDLPGCSAGALPVEVRLDPHDPTKFTGIATGSSGPGLYYSTGYTQAETTYKTDVTCKRTDGTTFVTSLTDSGANNPGAPLPSCDAQSLGSRPTKATVSAGPGGVPGNPVAELNWPQTSTQYPDCMAGTPCQMEVYMDDQKCLTSTQACKSWTQTKVAEPSRVTCRWGPYQLPVNDCNLLERAYESSTGTQINTPEDVDGFANPDAPQTSPTTAPTTSPSTAPSPSPSPGTSSVPGVIRRVNPDGSTTEEQTEQTPEGNSRTVTRTVNPDGSAATRTVVRAPNGDVISDNSVPTPGFGVGVLPIPIPGESNDDKGCLSTNFSWNPVSWVYAPVKCAVVWAFVPSPGSVEASQTQVKDAWANTGPAQYVGSMGAVFTAVGSVGDGASAGCEGPELKWSGSGPFGPISLRPLNGCPGTILGDKIAPVFRAVVLVGLYVGGAWVAARILSSSFGLQLPSWRGEKEGAA
jgi:hypothetical protein